MAAPAARRKSALKSASTSPVAERPVIGATCLSPGKPQATATLAEIAGLGLSMCETILWRGDDAPERVAIIRTFLDEAARHGVAVLLEPTYEPDLALEPGTRAIASDGTPSERKKGMWGGVCYRNAAYLRAIETYIANICRAYGDHPAVLKHHGRPVIAVGHEMQYQLSASDGHGGTLRAMTCYCPDCIAGFAPWLAARWEDNVERYNRAHRKPIRRFVRIAPPTRPEPDRVLWQEWTDYHAEAIPGAIALQRRVIERELPGALVTHEINDWYPNTWDCVYTGDNFWRMGDVLEHAFNDQYPMEWAPGSLWRIYLYTFTQDATQSAIGFERSFWTNGQAFPSWQGNFTEPPVEGHREQIYSALMHGANGLIWWTGGDLLGGTRAANAEMTRLVEILGDARPEKDPVAVLVPWTTYAQTRSGDRGDDLMGGYQLLSRIGFQVETIDETQISRGILRDRGYRALCIWGNSSLRPDARDRIERFVRDGGFLLADYGDLDTEPFETVFADMIAPERETRAFAYQLADGATIPIRGPRQVLRRRVGAEVVARYSDGPPAIVRMRVGRGTALRAGTLIGVDYAAGMGIYDWVHQERVRIEPAIESFVAAELAMEGIAPRTHADNPNLEAARFRLADGATAVLVVNHLRHPIAATVTIRGATGISARDLLSGAESPRAPHRARRRRARGVFTRPPRRSATGSRLRSGWIRWAAERSR